jgi:hypothetical protein
MGSDVLSRDVSRRNRRIVPGSVIPAPRQGDTTSPDATIGTPAAYGAPYVPGVFQNAASAQGGAAMSTYNGPGPGPAPLQHPGYHPLAQQDIPLHLLGLLDHRLGVEQEPVYVRFLHRHQTLAMAAAPWIISGFGWWANATEPMHAWAGALMDVLGGLLATGGGISHFAHGQDADEKITRGLMLTGGGLAFLGAACGMGAAALDLGLCSLATAGVLGIRHLVHRARFERAQDVGVELAHGLNPGPIPPGQPLPAPGPSMQMLASPHEARLYRAFFAAGIEGVTISNIDINPNNPDTWAATIGLPLSKISRDAVLKTRRQTIATNLQCRRLEMRRGSRTNDVQVTVYDGESRLTTWLEWTRELQTVSFADPVPVGFDEDHLVVLLDFRERHALVASQTGGGKSGVVNGILCSTLMCRDLVRIGIDAKPGAPEFSVYKPVMHFLATNPDEGYHALLGLVALINERGLMLDELSEQASKAAGRKVVIKDWDPKYGPYVLVPIDELAELTRNFPQATKLMESVLQLGRFVGVHVLSATQSPSSPVFGGVTDARQQYSIRFGLRSTEATVINIVFGQGAQSAGWRLDELKNPGEFMLQAVEYDEPRIYRTFKFDTGKGQAGIVIPDAVEIAYQALVDGLLPRLDARSADAFRAGVYEQYEGHKSRTLAEAFAAEFEEAFEEAAEQMAPEAKVMQMPARILRSAPTYPDRQLIPASMVELWQAFAERGDATIDELVALGLEGYGSRQPVTRELNTWVKAGYVWTQKDGRAVRFYLNESYPSPAAAGARTGAAEQDGDAS